MVGSSRDISYVEKLHYLKAQTTGEAVQHIANISVTAENFSRAWQVLTSRYKNRRILVSTYLDRIFEIKPLTQKSNSDLKAVLSTVKESIGTLQSLGAPTDQWDILIVYIITRRLVAHTLEAWELEQGNITEFATFKSLELFLEGRIRALETVQSRTSKPVTTTPKSHAKSKLIVRSHATITSGSKCAFCNAAHYIASCPDFASKLLSERQDFVNRKNLCFNCLGSHRLSACRILKRCRHYKGHRHTLLHRQVTSSPVATTLQDVAPASSISSPESFNAESVYSHHVACQLDRPQVLLVTARMTLVAAHGENIEVRALLDQGSEVSLIQESLVQLLHLPRCRTSVPIISVGSQKAISTRGAVSLHLRSLIHPSAEVKVSAFILPRITGRIPVQKVNTLSYNHLANLPLTDLDFAVPSAIDILLGADVYGSLLCGLIQRESSTTPIAQETLFGWILSGPVSSSTSSHITSFSIQSSDDIYLNEELQRFWLQEEITSSSVKQLTSDELKCENHFLANHSRDCLGRYIVRLPLRPNHPSLGECRSLAFRLLSTVQNRIHRNPSFGKLYIDFMNEYETLGHMQQASTVASCVPVYLPHHGVLREDSATTKLRVVFNGSAPTTSGISLNNVLYAGPKLQLDLDAILLRWRTHAIAFAADIVKMYRQISVHREDRDFQRILWSETGAPQEFQLTTVTYGLTCASYLALRVIQQLAFDEEKTFPQAAQILLKETYVDDILSGADTLQEAQQKAKQLVQLLRAGSFQLQKWASNEDSLLSSIAPQNNYSFTRDLPSETRTLGLTWHPASDVFTFHVSQSKLPQILTKRSALSRIAQIFDPLGWIAPVTIVVGKVFIQRLWKAQVGWDDPLPSSLARDHLAWIIFIEKMTNVSDMSIPRWIGISSSAAGVDSTDLRMPLKRHSELFCISEYLPSLRPRSY